MANRDSSPATNVFSGFPVLRRLLDSLSTHRRAWLLLGIALQVLVLLSMMAIPLKTRLTGETILVRVEPVDPRDLFRGDYVILSYEFSRFPPQGIPGLSSNSAHDGSSETVYVTLEPEADQRHYRAVKYGTERPTSGKFIRGRVVGYNRLEYGIESYFVQEGTGLQYEEAVRNRKLSAEIVLDGSGNAVLKGLVIE
jgi:uncharacterized membrane-anchored protein